MDDKGLPRSSPYLINGDDLANLDVQEIAKVIQAYRNGRPPNKKVQLKINKPKVPRKRLLCKFKVKEDYDYEHSDEETLFVYRDGTARWQWKVADDVRSYFKWKLAHSDMGPMLLTEDTNYEDGEHFECQWKSDDKREVLMAETIARALADLEMEKVLKGETDE